MASGEKICVGGKVENFQVTVTIRYFLPDEGCFMIKVETQNKLTGTQECLDEVPDDYCYHEIRINRDGVPEYRVRVHPHPGHHHGGGEEVFSQFCIEAGEFWTMLYSDETDCSRTDETGVSVWCPSDKVSKASRKDYYILVCHGHPLWPPGLGEYDLDTADPAKFRKEIGQWLYDALLKLLDHIANELAQGDAVRALLNGSTKQDSPIQNAIRDGRCVPTPAEEDSVCL